MATCRDWLSTLWPASYKGVPFYVERDGEEGSRRIVVHEFPMRDAPYIEDLGEGARYYDITAYVAGDSADTLATALIAILASIDPGPLVLNTHGPLRARCMTFGRDRSKDRHGYIAIKAKFVRDDESVASSSGGGLAGGLLGGVAAGALSAAGLANGVISALGTVASVVGSVFSVVTNVIGVIDFVFDAVTTVIGTVASVIETVISVATVITDVVQLADWVVSLGWDAYDVIADVRSAASDLVADASDYIDRISGASSEYADRVFEMVRDLGSVLVPRDAVRSFADVISQLGDDPVDPAMPPAVQQAVTNANETRRVIRIAALAAYTEAAIRVPYGSRDEGVTARADLVELYDAEIEPLTGADRAPAYIALSNARNAAVALLSQTIADLSPLVTVEANIPLPSLYWSWRLYQDPTRAGELVARNTIQHPSFFPNRFEALAR